MGLENEKRLAAKSFPMDIWSHILEFVSNKDFDLNRSIYPVERNAKTAILLKKWNKREISELYNASRKQDTRATDFVAKIIHQNLIAWNEPDFCTGYETKTFSAGIIVMEFSLSFNENITHFTIDNKKKTLYRAEFPKNFRPNENSSDCEKWLYFKLVSREFLVFLITNGFYSVCDEMLNHMGKCEEWIEKLLFDFTKIHQFEKVRFLINKIDSSRVLWVLGNVFQSVIKSGDIQSIEFLMSIDFFVSYIPKIICEILHSIVQSENLSVLEIIMKNALIAIHYKKSKNFNFVWTVCGGHQSEQNKYYAAANTTIPLDYKLEPQTNSVFRAEMLDYLFKNEVLYSMDELQKCFILSCMNQNLPIIKVLLKNAKIELNQKCQGALALLKKEQLQELFGQVEISKNLLLPVCMKRKDKVLFEYLYDPNDDSIDHDNIFFKACPYENDLFFVNTLLNSKRQLDMETAVYIACNLYKTNVLDVLGKHMNMNLVRKTLLVSVFNGKNEAIKRLVPYFPNNAIYDEVLKMNCKLGKTVCMGEIMKFHFKEYLSRCDEIIILYAMVNYMNSNVLEYLVSRDGRLKTPKAHEQAKQILELCDDHVVMVTNYQLLVNNENNPVLTFEELDEYLENYRKETSVCIDMLESKLQGINQ